MEIRTRRMGDVLIADMVGRLDSRTAGPASTELNQIAQGGQGKLILNVHGLEYVSSAVSGRSSWRPSWCRCTAAR